jgi:hypothetical protein
MSEAAKGRAITRRIELTDGSVEKLHQQRVADVADARATRPTGAKILISSNRSPQ